jgi:hypothetical protein
MIKVKIEFTVDANGDRIRELIRNIIDQLDEIDFGHSFKAIQETST